MTVISLCICFVVYMVFLGGGSVPVSYTLRTAALLPVFHLQAL